MWARFSDRRRLRDHQEEASAQAAESPHHRFHDHHSSHFLYLMSPAAMKTGSLLSRLVMLSTENWLMLSLLLVWASDWHARTHTRAR